MENRPPVIISGMSQLITSHVPVLTIYPLPLRGPFVPSASGFPSAAYKVVDSAHTIGDSTSKAAHSLKNSPSPTDQDRTLPLPSLL